MWGKKKQTKKNGSSKRIPPLHLSSHNIAIESQKHFKKLELLKVLWLNFNKSGFGTHKTQLIMAPQNSGIEQLMDEGTSENSEKGESTGDSVAVCRAQRQGCMCYVEQK